MLSAQTDTFNMAVMRNLLLVSLLAARKFLLTSGSQVGCSPDDHIQNKICRSDFVIKGTLREKVGEERDDIIYSVVIKTQFTISKAFSLANENSLSRIFVTKSLAQRLNVGDKYILSGRLTNANGTARMLVSDCDWAESWTTVTQRQKSFLHKKLYEANCDCLVVSDKLTKSPVACQLPQSVDHCHQRLSFCTAKNSDGQRTKCRWSANGDLKECLMAVQQT